MMAATNRITWGHIMVLMELVDHKADSDLTVEVARKVHWQEISDPILGPQDLELTIPSMGPVVQMLSLVLSMELELRMMEQS